MNKSRIYHIIEWTVALAACGYLVWRLVTYDDYAALWATLRGMGWTQWGALALCVALMPVNMALEAWRWRTLINGDASHNGENGANGGMMRFAEAQRQVYYSKLAGVITPWRLGEYPARAVLMGQSPITHHPSPITHKDLWSYVLSMGAVGSATMTAAIVMAGGAALLAQVLFQESMDAFVIVYRYCHVFILTAVLLALALYFAPRLLQRWATVSRRLVAVSLGQSLLRLLCWCVQLWLVLWALGAFSLQLSAFSLLPIYYLLVTITPNVPIAEAGVRGAWAVVLFGSVNAALAGVLLWAVNTLLPCIIWPFLRKNK
jgi:hypothetical protein